MRNEQPDGKLQVIQKHSNLGVLKCSIPGGGGLFLTNLFLTSVIVPWVPEPKAKKIIKLKKKKEKETEKAIKAFSVF